MSHLINKPTDPYDPAWELYRAQNPGLRLGLSADVPEDEDQDPPAVDLTFIPDSFKKDDGYDTAGFRTHFDELASFKAQADERTAALPTEAGGYEFALGEGFQWPEGFDPTAFPQAVLGEDGNPVLGEDGQPKTRDLSPGDLIDAKDPDIAKLQEVMLANQVPPAVMSELASIFAGRELRSLSKAGEDYAEQQKALGPDAKSRMATVKRAIQTAVPEAQANALIGDITSADALRALEGIMKPGRKPVSHTPGGPDLDGMSSRELIELGMKQQMAGS